MLPVSPRDAHYTLLQCGKHRVWLQRSSLLPLLGPGQAAAAELSRLTPHPEQVSVVGYCEKNLNIFLIADPSRGQERLSTC